MWKTLSKGIVQVLSTLSHSRKYFLQPFFKFLKSRSVLDHAELWAFIPVNPLCMICSLNILRFIICTWSNMCKPRCDDYPQTRVADSHMYHHCDTVPFISFALSLLQLFSFKREGDLFHFPKSCCQCSTRFSFSQKHPKPNSVNCVWTHYWLCDVNVLLYGC